MRVIYSAFAIVILAAHLSAQTTQLPNEYDEIVGIGGLTKAKLWAARAKVRNAANLALLKTKMHLYNPFLKSETPEAYLNENFVEYDDSYDPNTPQNNANFENYNGQYNTNNQYSQIYSNQEILNENKTPNNYNNQEHLNQNEKPLNYNVNDAQNTQYNEHEHKQHNNENVYNNNQYNEHKNLVENSYNNNNEYSQHKTIDENVYNNQDTKDKTITENEYNYAHNQNKNMDEMVYNNDDYIVGDYLPDFLKKKPKNKKQPILQNPTPTILENDHFNQERHSNPHPFFLKKLKEHLMALYNKYHGSHSIYHSHHNINEYGSNRYPITPNTYYGVQSISSKGHLTPNHDHNSHGFSSNHDLTHSYGSNHDLHHGHASKGHLAHGGHSFPSNVHLNHDIPHGSPLKDHEIHDSAHGLINALPVPHGLVYKPPGSDFNVHDTKHVTVNKNQNIIIPNSAHKQSIQISQSMDSRKNGHLVQSADSNGNKRLYGNNHNANVYGGHLIQNSDWRSTSDDVTAFKNNDDVVSLNRNDEVFKLSQETLNNNENRKPKTIFELPNEKNKQPNAFMDSVPSKMDDLSNNDKIVGSPILIETPIHYYQDEYFRDAKKIRKRSVDSMDPIAHTLAEMFAEDEALFGGYNGGRHHIIKKQKRHAPILQLITDPNAKLDVSKTMDNIGAVAKNSLEDKRAPMYHVRNMMGSAKSAMLSALRIPPQDLIIPSQYKIVDSNKVPITQRRSSGEMFDNNSIGDAILGQEPKKMSLLERARVMYQEKLNKKNIQQAPLSPRTQSIKENRILKASTPRFGAPEENDDPLQIMSTFQKIGQALRESVISGQETLQHMGDMLYSARKAFSTSRFSAPRVFLPYARTPALLTRSNFGDEADNPVDKVMLVTPKILDVKTDKISNNLLVNNDEFVGAGEIMDALGISNPLQEDFSLRKIVLHQNPLAKQPLLQSRSNFEKSDEALVKNTPGDNPKYFVVSDTIDPEKEDVQETLETLDDVKEMVGAKNLKELVQKMKNDLNDAIQQKKEELKERFAENAILGKKNKLEDDSSPEENEKPQLSNNLLEEARNKIKSLREANENALNFLKKFNMTHSPLSLNKTMITRNVEDKKDKKEYSFKEKFENLQKNLLAYRNNKNLNVNKPPTEDKEEIIKENIKDVFGDPPEDKIDEKSSQETARASMPMADYLKKPFMGLPSKKELVDYFQGNGDDVNMLDNVDEVVGASNPMSSAKIVEELPPSAIVDTSGNVYALLNDVKLTVDGEDARHSVTIPKHLLKPYMGKFKRKNLDSDSYYGLYSRK